MSLADFITGRSPRTNQEMDPLAVPLAEEAKSLELHVELCARRYGQLNGKLDDLNGSQRWQFVFLAAIVILLLAGKVITFADLLGLCAGS